MHDFARVPFASRLTVLEVVGEPMPQGPGFSDVQKFPILVEDQIDASMVAVGPLLIPVHRCERLSFLREQGIQVAESEIGQVGMPVLALLHERTSQVVEH